MLRQAWDMCDQFEEDRIVRELRKCRGRRKKGDNERVSTTRPDIISSEAMVLSIAILIQ